MSDKRKPRPNPPPGGAKLLGDDEKDYDETPPRPPGLDSK